VPHDVVASSDPDDGEPCPFQRLHNPVARQGRHGPWHQATSSVSVSSAGGPTSAINAASPSRRSAIAASGVAGGGAALTDHPERQEIANTALPLASSRPVMPLVVWSAEDASQMAQRPRAWDAGREEEDRRSSHEAAIAVFSRTHRAAADSL
jgi:hypothetical protein